MKSSLHPFAFAAVLLGTIYLVWLLFVVNGVSGFLFFILELLVFLLFVIFCINHWNRKYQLSGGSYSLRTVVDVFIPTKNEPLEMIEKTVAAASTLYHPNTRLYLIDDGNRESVKVYAESLGITYLVRENYKEKQYKAAALNHALQKSYGQYILVLDADQVVQPTIIDSLLGHFKDADVAYVSTRQNFDVEEDDFNHDHLFYEYMQAGKNEASMGISCGSGVIYRREALEKIGGFQEWNIVEDLYTSYVFICEGYKSVYVNQSFTLGIAPTDLPTIYKQRGTWAADTLRLFLWKMPLFNKKLTWKQRLHYYEMGYIYLVSALVVPAIYFLNFYSLFFNVHIVNAGIAYLLLKIPSFYCILRVYNELGQGTSSSRMWASLFPVYLKSFIDACLYRKPLYTVTKKISVRSVNLGYIWPHIALISIGSLALIYHLYAYGYSSLLVINFFWLVLMVYWFYPVVKKGLVLK